MAVIDATLIGRALHRYRRGQGFESRYNTEFFSGFLFPTVKVVYTTAMIILHLSVFVFVVVVVVLLCFVMKL